MDGVVNSQGDTWEKTTVHHDETLLLWRWPGFIQSDFPELLSSNENSPVPSVITIERSALSQLNIGHYRVDFS